MVLNTVNVLKVFHDLVQLQLNSQLGKRSMSKFKDEVSEVLLHKLEATAIVLVDFKCITKQPRRTDPRNISMYPTPVMMYLQMTDETINVKITTNRNT